MELIDNINRLLGDDLKHAQTRCSPEDRGLLLFDVRV